MSIYDLKVAKRDGSEFDMASLKGKVLLIVNTATGCGFTPQYEALENLYRSYHEQGLKVLDFPCNQFGHQAPGSDDEIHEFCTSKYDTSFDQFKKIDVNGENEDPLFTCLKEAAPVDIVNDLKNKAVMKTISTISATYKKDNDIMWNFTKFLVDQNGEVVMRVSPVESPLIMKEKIKELLG
jgi:glutathione peroxidase